MTRATGFLLVLAGVGFACAKKTADSTVSEDAADPVVSQEEADPVILSAAEWETLLREAVAEVLRRDPDADSVVAIAPPSLDVAESLPEGAAAAWNAVADSFRTVSGWMRKEGREVRSVGPPLSPDALVLMLSGAEEKEAGRFQVGIETIPAGLLISRQRFCLAKHLVVYERGDDGWKLGSRGVMHLLHDLTLVPSEEKESPMLNRSNSAECREARSQYVKVALDEDRWFWSSGNRTLLAFHDGRHHIVGMFNGLTDLDELKAVIHMAHHHAEPDAPHQDAHDVEGCFW